MRRLAFVTGTVMIVVMGLMVSVIHGYLEEIERQVKGYRF